MRIPRVIIGAAIACVAIVAAPATGGVTARPDACKLLKAAVHGHTWEHRVRVDPGHDRMHCSYSDGKPPAENQWLITLDVTPYPPFKPSVAQAREAWQKIFAAVRAAKGNGGTPVRLRGFGADDAFGVESTNETARSGPSSTAAVQWRKGFYLGEIHFTAPLSSHHGDLDDVEDLLRDVMRGMPRS